MRVECCYRLKRFGEPIHTMYDSELGIIEGMPKDFCFVNLKVECPYSPANYTGSKGQTGYDYRGMCEAILLSNDDYAIVLECCHLGYDIITFNGQFIFKENILDEGNKWHPTNILTDGLYKFIGYRTSIVEQYRSSSGIFRLLYREDTGKVYTSKGVLTPTFDVSKLDSPSWSYAGYKDAVLAGYDGVVYLNERPRFVKIAGDKLNMI